MFFCFKRKFQILGAVLTITIIYFFIQILFFIYYNTASDEKLVGGFKNEFIHPKFNVLNRRTTRISAKNENSKASLKKKAQLQIPFSFKNVGINKPKLAYLLPFNLKREKLNLTILDVDYLDFNNFETTQTGIFIRGVDIQKANSYLPNAKGLFNCLDSNVFILLNVLIF